MLEKIVIVALIVDAIWVTMLDGMIFGKLGNWLDAHLSEYWGKPVFDCPACMSGVYGSVIYWLIWGESGKEWVIVFIGAIGFNTIFVKILSALEDLKPKK